MENASDKFEQDQECRLQSVQASLREKESQLVACEQRLEARDNRIQELESEIQSLRKELHLLSDKSSPMRDVKKEIICNDTSHETLINEMSNKNKEIECLNMELRKRTFNLQVI